MYVVCYLIVDGIHPEDSEIVVCGVFGDKVEAEEWAEEIGGISLKANYFPNHNKQKEK